MPAGKGLHLSALGGFTCVPYLRLHSASRNAYKYFLSQGAEPACDPAMSPQGQPELQHHPPAQGKEERFWLLVINVICHSVIRQYLGKVPILFSHIVKKKKISVNVSALPVLSLFCLLNVFSSSNRTAHVQPQLLFSKTAFSLGKS